MIGHFWPNAKNLTPWLWQPRKPSLIKCATGTRGCASTWFGKEYSMPRLVSFRNRWASKWKSDPAIFLAVQMNVPFGTEKTWRIGRGDRDLFGINFFLWIAALVGVRLVRMNMGWMKRRKGLFPAVNAHAQSFVKILQKSILIFKKFEIMLCA